MKKIFAFAMALVSMAAVMTSCGNDDTDFIEQNAPAPRTMNTNTNTNSNTGKDQAAEDQTEQVVDIFLPVTDVQLEVMNIEITLSMSGHITTITPEEMTEVEFPARVPDTDAAGTVKLLKFRVPGTFTMRDLRGATIERTAKLNDEGIAKYLGQKISLFNNYTCTVTEVGKDVTFNINNFNYMPSVNMTEAEYFDELLEAYQVIGEKSPIIY